MPSPRKANFAGFTQTDLKELSKVLFYEFEAAYEYSAALTALHPVPVQSDYERWQRNALIEAFGIHCRALVSFFFPTGIVCETDVIASDFKPRHWSPVKSAGLDAAHKQANKEIAHITTERLGLNQSPQKQSAWNFQSHLGEICDLIETFLQAVPTQNLAPGVETAMQEIIRNSRTLVGPSVAPAGHANVPGFVPMPPQTTTHSPNLERVNLHARTAPTQIPPSSLVTD
jgi:hypothetical protein